MMESCTENRAAFSASGGQETYGERLFSVYNENNDS